VLIDRYLAEAPAGPFDAEAFASFRSDPRQQSMVKRILDDITLKVLRQDAQLSKERLGETLAAELGLRGHERRVKARYHDVETGSVDPARVRRRVWEALGRALGTSIERVHGAAAAAFAARRGGAASMAFARTGEGGLAERSPADAPEDSQAVVDRAFFTD
jgi:IS5 family transposase